MIIKILVILATSVYVAYAQANIPIYPITTVDSDPSKHVGYFSDPYHVPYRNETRIYISGTTHKYLECDGALEQGCASSHGNKYTNGSNLLRAADAAGAKICSAAGIHPFQSRSDQDVSWDALVTLHVQQKTKPCDGIKGWSVIVHARPENVSDVAQPPTAWIGDQVLIGSFSDDERANYDGKYFQTPAGKLYLVYQKLFRESPRRVGIAVWPMDDPKTITPNSNYTFLLIPDEDLNSERYVRGDDNFKLTETGNIRAINGKFIMAYSVGAFDRPTYKLGIAYSDTFLPAKDGQYYRKLMKNNPAGLWNSTTEKEVYYLLQSEETEDGWHFVGDQVKAPGVPTAAKIGANNEWVLTFAGYDPSDADKVDGKFMANHRRPYYIGLHVNVPEDKSVNQANDTELQGWIVPKHG
ncbi:hypothetical protein BJ170DRAFT_708120 [Xylariales sp. AK1849]|nr:hypothetical protein BJ170DRAFT_708120 [Xylariales sp. AK1849]